MLQLWHELWLTQQADNNINSEGVDLQATLNASAIARTFVKACLCTTSHTECNACKLYSFLTQKTALLHAVKQPYTMHCFPEVSANIVVLGYTVDVTLKRHTLPGVSRPQQQHDTAPWCDQEKHYHTIQKITLV